MAKHFNYIHIQQQDQGKEIVVTVNEALPPTISDPDPLSQYYASELQAFSEWESSCHKAYTVPEQEDRIKMFALVQAALSNTGHFSLSLSEAKEKLREGIVIPINKVNNLLFEYHCSSNCFDVLDKENCYRQANCKRKLIVFLAEN